MYEEPTKWVKRWRNWREWIAHLFTKLEFQLASTTSTVFLLALSYPQNWTRVVRLPWESRAKVTRTSGGWGYVTENRRNKWKLTYWRWDLRTSSPAGLPECWQPGRYPPGRMNSTPPCRKMCRRIEATRRYWCQGWPKETAQPELFKVKTMVSKTHICIIASSLLFGYVF